MVRWAALTIIVALGILAMQPLPALAATADDCAPAGNVKFICGVNNVEDFAPVPGTRWVIGSDLAAAGQQGYLYLFDTSKGTATAVQPEDIAIQPDKEQLCRLLRCA